MKYFALLFVLFLTACGSGSADDPVTVPATPYPDGAGPPPLEAQNCNSFPIERTEFEAGEGVLFSLPGAIARAEERVFWFHSDALSIPYPMAIMDVEDDEESHGIFMPIPPRIGTSTYTLQLAGTLGDGTVFSCPTHDIEITLNPAPAGTAKNVAESLGKVIDAMAVRHGGNRDLLETIGAGEDAGEVDAMLLPLAVANYHLRKPGDGLIDGIENLSGDDLAYFNAGLAVIAESARLEETVASVDAPVNAATAFKTQIRNATDLAYWSKERTQYCGASKTGYANSVLAAGFIALHGGFIGQVANGYALVGTVFVEVFQAFCDLLPARLINLRVDTTLRVIEDEAGIPTGLPISARANTILVDASSNQWSWTGSALRVALQFLSAVGGKYFEKYVTSAVGQEKAITFFGRNLPPKTSEHLISVFVGVTSNVTGFFAGEYSTMNDKEGVYPQAGPYTWTDIDVNDPRWVRMVSRTNVVRPYDNDAEDLVYQFTKVGEDAVTLVPKIEEFPLRELDQLILFMGVDKIEIDVPEEILLAPGETFEINYAVRNAEDPSLDWSTAAGTLRGFSVLQTSGETGTVEHQAPSDASAFPYIIEVSSRSEGGLRAPSLNPPDRSRLIIVRTGDVSISPRGVCVPNGETLELKVAKSGPLSSQPEFLASEGQGTLENTTYTAPSEGSGDVRVTVNVGEFSDTTVFSYGQCTCYFSVVSREGAHSREFGMGLTDFSIGDFVEQGDSVAPIVTMSMGESLSEILTDPRYILSFAPGFWSTATMREGLDAEFTADLRGESQFDVGWFSNGGFLMTEALQYLGRPQLKGRGVVYHGDDSDLFPVNVSFSMVFDESICATETLFNSINFYPPEERPEIKVF